MKYTALAVKQTDLLENLISRYGLIVTTKQIVETAKRNWDYKQSKNIITKLIKNGWLIRIKRGLYAISELSGRGFLSLSSYLISNLLVQESYTSFESALQYHNMFDQLISRTVSVSLKAYKSTKLNNVEYGFVKTKRAFYFGYENVSIDDRIVHIATPEKALVDMVTFHRNKLAIDVVIEKLITYKNDWDFNRFNEYLSKFPVTTVKIFGFIFDLLGIDSTYLYNLVRSNRGTARMFASDKKFNAKWRIYYDEYFDKYKS